nr:HAMP domain-containing sensor histidine kinase [Methylorubrum extorquens]
MNSGSLRLRLGLAAAGLIALALVLAGIGLTLIFDRVLDARTADGLDRTAKLIAGQVALAPDGAPTLPREPPDSRFSTPYGGLYWQVERADGTALRSRSLWDRSLGTLPDTSEEPAVGDLAGPDGGQLIAVTRRVSIPGNGGAVALAVTVAEDRRDLAQSRATFLRLLVPSLGALFAALTLAMSLFVRRALAPFRTLRADLAAIHAGTQARLPDTFPEEVRPLVADLNRLLDAQERDLERARTGAGDMAHGLKTPLAVLDALARRTEAADPALAAEIAEQAHAMGRQVERTLARARAASGACGGAPARSDRHWRASSAPSSACPRGRPCAGRLQSRKTSPFPATRATSPRSWATSSTTPANGPTAASASREARRAANTVWCLRMTALA